MLRCTHLPLILKFMTITKKDLQDALKAQSKDLQEELDTRFEAQTEKLVEFLQDQFKGINDRLDIVETKVDRALYTETVHVEARFRRLEKLHGLKEPAQPVEPPPPRNA